MQGANFWEDQEKAAQVSQKAADLKEEVSNWQILKLEVDELADFILEAEKEGGNNLIVDIENQYKKLQTSFKGLEFFMLFSGRFDSSNALVAIHAGTGGVDAQDWAQMLLRMYLRYCERQGFKTKILDKQMGKEAGIKSVVLEIGGKNAYGYLKSEAGTHRLVRISPFDAEKMRHTSFALVEVLPDLGQAAEIEIKPDDLRIDTFRSSGPGGQSVNTTDSAVRITHLPTGIVVQCQDERSQIKNRATAMKILRARLYELKKREKESAQAKEYAQKQKIEWGSQIRSYVMHPYSMVKDHRTDYQTSNALAVLNGDLDEFIEAYLKKLKIKNEK